LQGEAASLSLEQSGPYRISLTLPRQGRDRAQSVQIGRVQVQLVPGLPQTLPVPFDVESVTKQLEALGIKK
jgi:hypothetical protein